MKLDLLCLLTFVLSVTRGGVAQEKGNDLKLLQGAWVVVSAEMSGQKSDKYEKVKLVFAGETLTFQIPNVKTDKGRIQLDSAKKPKEISFLPQKDERKMPAWIYHLEGDTLKLCWDASGAICPSEFTSKNKPGSTTDLRLLVLKREKGR